MKRVLPLVLAAITVVLIVMAWFQSGGVERHVLRSAATPEQATRLMLSQIQTHNFDAAYARLANRNDLDKNTFIHEFTGSYMRASSAAERCWRTSRSNSARGCTWPTSCRSACRTCSTSSRSSFTAATRRRARAGRAAFSDLRAGFGGDLAWAVATFDGGAPDRS